MRAPWQSPLRARTRVQTTRFKFTGVSQPRAQAAALEDEKKVEKEFAEKQAAEAAKEAAAREGAARLDPGGSMKDSDLDGEVIVSQYFSTLLFSSSERYNGRWQRRRQAAGPRRQHEGQQTGRQGDASH